MYRFAYVNKEVNKLKQEQEENLKRVRRAYNTKLSNAVIKISASFEVTLAAACLSLISFKLNSFW
jgi:hypothetical protein